MNVCRRLFALLVTMTTVLLSIVPAGAQSSDDTGIINITVRTADTKAPLQDARITLFGATQASALTNKSGIVKYTDVPTGLYRVRVTKGGYQGSTSTQFEVLGNKEVDIDFNMGVQVARSGNTPTPTPASSASPSGTSNSSYKVIGSVTAKVSINTHDVDVDSAVRRVSDSLTDALSKIAGVDITQATNDPDAAQTISLNGHDETQTAVTLDGIPLGAPGTAVNLRGINTDLFSGASVSFAATAGALGGTVNFRTLQPTQTWVSRFSSSYGSFDKFNYQLGETGSIGKLGIAVLHTLREGNSYLTGFDYEDQSGLTYPHAGESSNAGDFVKLRYAMDESTTISLTTLQNNQGISSLSTQDVTNLPSGIGPGNTTESTFQFGYVTVQQLIGETTTSITSYVNSNNGFQDDAERFIDGTASPLVSNTRAITHGIAFLSTVNQGKSTWTLNGSTIDTTTFFNPIINPSPQFVIHSAFGNAAQTYQLSDQYKINDRLVAGPNVSLADTNGTGVSILGGLATTWKPTGNDTYGLSGSLGSSQAANGLIQTFSDPSNARFNCDAGTANVSGPGDQPGKQSAISYDGSWTHQWRFGSFNIEGFQQTQAGQLVNASIVAPGLGLDAGNPYINALQGFYSLPTACGAAAVLNPNNVYVSELIGDTTRVYRGYDLSGKISFGPHLVVIPSYQTNAALVTAADARLLTLNSTTILGAQIPGRPVHRGNLTLDGDIPALQLELLANAQYVGSNNAQHIDPYALVTVGASHQFGPGRATFLITNLFNTETGLFSTELYAQPIPLSGGGQLFQAANPNPPRQFTLSYSFNTGARNGAGGARQSRSAAAAQAAQAAQAFAAPAGTTQNGQRRGGLGSFTPYPPPEGTDPLSVASQRDSCTADDAKLAEPTLEQLRAAVAAFTAGQPLPTVDALAILPHGDPKGTWYFELRPNLPNTGANGQNGQNGQGGGRLGGFGGFGGRGGGGGGGGGGAITTGEGGERITVQPNPNATPGPRPSISPEVRATFAKFRATISCTYFSAMTQADATAKGYTAFTGRVGLGYAPGIGLFAVRAPELGTGGGSLKK
jgi:hypothetical protein